ncbi:MAG: triose-phosphate isomerase [Rickettsiaceae bacterium]|nr:triose-phosphate isomerase [Rickettsiaceae bacterium]
MNHIIANWKMNLSINEARKLCENIDENVIIAPPMPYLAQLILEFNSRPFAAQDVSKISGYGSFTGEVSAELLSKIGTKYAIIGHSERRQHLSERPDDIKTKAKNCIATGIIPIICIGENEEARKNGTYMDYIESEVTASIPNLDGYILAYEPLWSIGTGKAANVLELQEVFSHIKDFTIAKPLALVYGGSINSDNVSEIISVQEIDGLLIGKSSLDADELNKIARIWRRKFGEA